jgi:hypothetical protein
MPSTLPSFSRAMFGASLFAAIGSVAVVSPALAVPSISVAVSESAGTSGLSLLGTTTTGIFSFAFATTNFAGTVSGEGSPILPQPTLDTSSIDARTKTSADGTLYIYVTEQGLTSPQGVASFLSSFTANLFTGGAVSVIEKTFVSTTNALWGGTALGTQTFTSIGSTTQLDTTPSLGSPYSETAEFIVHINGTGSVNDTINIIDPVPEPMSIALLGAGMIGIGAVRRRSQRTAA